MEFRHVLVYFQQQTTTAWWKVDGEVTNTETGPQWHQKRTGGETPPSRTLSGHAYKPKLWQCHTSHLGLYLACDPGRVLGLGWPLALALTLRRHSCGSHRDFVAVLYYHRLAAGQHGKHLFPLFKHYRRLVLTG